MLATKQNTTFRAACLTIFNVEDIDCLPDKLSYFAYGKETCPTSGRKHLQAFAYSESAMRFTAWKKLFPTAHIEQMRGSFSKNEAYCSKQSALVEFGQRPMENGHRRSDLICKDLIDADPKPSIDERYEASEELSFVRYKKFFEGYREYKRAKTIKGDFTKPEVTYIYGPSGSGKTYYVTHLESDLYRVPEGWQWYDGYAGEEAVLLDNVDLITPQNRSFFLTLIDRYPIQVPVKGGFTWWKPKRIYITSIRDPVFMAGQFADAKEFNRRITVFKEMAPNHEYDP